MLVWYVYKKLNILALFSNFNWLDVVALVAWNSLFILTYAFQNYLMIRRISPSVLFSDVLFMQSINNLLNKVSPRGGAIYRAAYLRKRYSFPYSKFLSTITGLYVISFSVQAVMGLLCLVIIHQRTGISSWPLVLAFLGIILVCGLLIYINPEIKRTDNRILNIFNSILTGWKQIKSNKTDILIYVILSLLSLILTAIQYGYIYHLLGLELDFIETTFVSSLGIMTALLNITPDGLGINEALLIYSSSLMSRMPAVLVLGALVMRGVGWISSVVFGSVSYIFLERSLRQHEQQQG